MGRGIVGQDRGRDRDGGDPQFGDPGSPAAAGVWPVSAARRPPRPTASEPRTSGLRPASAPLRQLQKDAA